MSFVVEDGSIVPGANSYQTVAQLDDYWLSRNVTLTNTEDEKKAALVVVTQYVNGNNKWKGSIVDAVQALDFPRENIVDDEGREIASDSIPVNLGYAINEYAKRELDNPSIQPDVPDTGAVKSLMTKLDKLEKKTEYQDGTGGYFGIKEYPLADNYLIGLKEGGTFGNFGKIGCC